MTTPAIYTKKSDVKAVLDDCLISYSEKGLVALSDALHQTLLQSKIRFPLLEYCGEVISETLPTKEHLPFCDKLMKPKTIGGDVVVGKLLQLRLSDHFDESFAKATEYISEAISWHVCDTIGERVFGLGLLSNPQSALQKLEQLVNHKNPWVVRSTGAGFHYAIKKGLGSQDVECVFRLLLSKALTKPQHEKQGIGWAAKTTAKFHPALVESHRNTIDNPDKVGQWFRTKVRIGLERNQYVKRNRG